jgi:cytochrome c553
MTVRAVGFAVLLALSLPSAAAPPRAIPDSMAERVLACVACHGDEGRATSEGYFPRIAGKPAGYIYNQLVNFRDGKRVNPMMTYLVDNLPDAYLRDIAAHFSALSPPYAAPPAGNATAAQLARGRVLARQGDAARKLPACADCHGDALTGVAPAVPGLLGLPRDYLASQLGAWQNKSRRAATPDCMAEVVARLSADDIAAATAWLSSQPVPTNAKPASRAAKKAPLDCGGLR